MSSICDQSNEEIQNIIFKFAQGKLVDDGISLDLEMEIHDSGLDSLDLIELSYELEEEFGTDIDPAKFAVTNQTVGEFVSLVANHISQSRVQNA